MSNMYVGEMRVFAGNFAINEWAFCQGQVVAISQNPTLFNLIGTTWGGDGQTTFNLPNLKGNLCVGQGTGTGIQPWLLGQLQGNSAITLIQSQVPAHTHQATFADSVQFTYEKAGPTNQLYPGRLQKGTNYTPNNPNTVLNASSITTQGGSQPHENTMPQLVMNCIISLFGIYPSQ